MKKTLFVAMLAGATLAGCVKNEPVAKDNGSPEPITFDAPVVTIPTKATEIEADFPKDETFAVYAYYHVGDYTSFDEDATLYMNNVTCQANNSNAPDYWEPTTPYYWPKTDNSMLTFGAYTPVMGNDKVKWGTSGFKFIDYTVPTASAEQKDLLYSARVYNQKSSHMLGAADKNPYQGITITFQHALSSIVFSARATENDAVKLTGIKVINVINSGTFDQGYTNSGANADEAHPAWELGAERQEYVVYNGSDGGKQLTTEKTYFGVDPNDNNKDGKRTSDLILVPQPLNTSGHEVSVVIDYTINGIADSKTLKLAVKNPDANPEENANLYEWKMGFRYTYDIEIGLTKIYFNPRVDPWTDQEGITIW